ncbi:unnamed protein product [Schistosoma curassoni]|uniref:Uncharacterized protein n=1 Tax=Schistosoma curassoni TaxID=6186 RepID=A0A183JG70_9TREM|nr:unnamed protein product [Schistosoma curassoni]
MCTEEPTKRDEVASAAAASADTCAAAELDGLTRRVSIGLGITPLTCSPERDEYGSQIPVSITRLFSKRWEPRGKAYVGLTELLVDILTVFMTVEWLSSGLLL